MADQYSEAADAAAIGKKLIKQHHDHLSGRRVEFLFVERLDKDGQSQAIVTKGKNLYGKAKLVTGLNAFLASELDSEARPFFVIVITKHFWTNASQEFKHALVDHELQHCWYDSESDRCSMIDHDVTEFTAIVKRHGLWHHDLDTFVKAAKQKSLQFDKEKEAESKPVDTKRGLAAVPSVPAP
jgi:putative metallopeptidase